MRVPRQQPFRGSGGQPPQEVINLARVRLHLTFHQAAVACSKYHAVSYEWGSDEDTNYVVVNGGLLRVRRNIHNFLTTLIESNRAGTSLQAYQWPKSTVLQAPKSSRSNVFSYLPSKLSWRTHSRKPKEVEEKADENENTNPCFWIDAICLTQGDIAERNHQVRRMYGIYHHAATVVVWLGCGNLEIRKGLSYFRANPHPPKDSADVKEAYSAIDPLLSQSHWGRAWIMQELLAATAEDIILMYGEYDFTWTFVKKLTFDGRREAGSGFTQNRLAERYCDIYEEGIVGGISLFSLVTAFANLQCLDERDRIYSIRALVPGGDDFDVNYDEEAPALAMRTISHFFLNAEFKPRTIFRSLGMSTVGLMQCMTFTSRKTRDSHHIFILRIIRPAKVRLAFLPPPCGGDRRRTFSETYIVYIKDRTRGSKLYCYEFPQGPASRAQAMLVYPLDMEDFIAAVENGSLSCCVDKYGISTLSNIVNHTTSEFSVIAA